MVCQWQCYHLQSTCWAPALCQLSVNQHQLVSSLCKLVKLADSSKWQKSPFQVTRLEKWLFGCFWIRSRIGAFNKLSETEQLLDLSQYFKFILFVLHQFSSSNLNFKLETMKVPWELPLDRTEFLLTTHREWTKFCSYRLWNGKGRPGKLWSLQSLSTSFGLLRWPPQGQATFGQNVLLNP